MKSTTDIATTDARKIAKRLLNHWKHKFEVSESSITESEHLYSIFMPEAKVQLTAQLDVLKVEIQTDRDDYTMLEKVVIDHLNRMAHQEFNVEWQHQA